MLKSPVLTECALCGVEAGEHSISDGEHQFCCHGCHAVFNILASKSQLDNYSDSPIFKEALRSGLISNPALLDQIRANQPDVPIEELEKLHLEINEMWCPSCAEVIKLVLLKEKGVKNCVVDYSTDLASVEYAPRYISKDKIYRLIASLGYKGVSLENASKKPVSKALYFRFIVAAFFSLNIMMFSYPIYAGYFDGDTGGYDQLFVWISFFASLPVIFFSAWPIFQRFWHSMKVGLLGMETLVSIGVSSAFIASLTELYQGGTHVYFDSMSVIITLVLLGKIIESRAKFSAKESLLRLSHAIPKKGRKRFDDGTDQFVSLKEVAIGDLLIVFTGEKVVLDGVVIDGEGACDESLMTGEVIPVSKKVGSDLLGGTIMRQGWVLYRVTTTPEQTALHKILEMVELEIGHKTVYLRAADRIVKIFVPAVCILALGVYMYEHSLMRALSVLLISCPCAIGIAAPFAESKVMNELAKLGAIVRNRGILSILGKESVVIFDKTGTVTEGRFHVIGGLEEINSEHRQVIKALTTHSTHPISVAISQSITANPIKLDKIEEVIGRGVKGEWNGKRVLIGSSKFLSEYGILCEGEDEVTTVYFSKGGKLLLGDSIREGVREVVEALKPARTILLSGDHELSVATVAKATHFDEWRSGYSPLQKKEFVDSLRENGETVCMIGDGINDAPALTAADIGISVVTATDISIQVSDLLLTTDRLNVLLRIRNLAKLGRKIVNQNLFWAFIYNIVGIGLAVYGVLNPLISAIAMVLSSLIVLFNSSRIKS